MPPSLVEEYKLFKILTEPAVLPEEVRQKRQRDFDKFPVLTRLLLTWLSAELAVEAGNFDIPVFGIEVALEIFGWGLPLLDKVHRNHKLLQY